jgi:hypothetical protein
MKKFLITIAALLLPALAQAATIAWTNSYPATSSVTIEIKDKTAPDWSVLATVPGNETSWTGDLPYQPGQTVQIRAKATTNNVISPYTYIIETIIPEKEPQGLNVE